MHIQTAECGLYSSNGKPFDDMDGIITQSKSINPLRKQYHPLPFTTRLTAKLTAEPRENQRKWETPVDKMAKSEHHQAPLEAIQADS
jgi:hypothetical protein